MSVRVLSVSRMPYNAKVWVVDHKDGRYIVYVDRELLPSSGAEALQAALDASGGGWQRLDDTAVSSALRTITG